MAYLSRHLLDAAKVIVEVMNKKGTKRGDLVRLKAAELLMDRVLGKSVESFTVNLSDGEPWQHLVATAIVATAHELEAGDDSDIVEGEVVDEEEPRRIKVKRKH
jgi:hypothetical protein